MPAQLRNIHPVSHPNAEAVTNHPSSVQNCSTCGAQMSFQGFQVHTQTNMMSGAWECPNGHTGEYGR